MKEITEDAKEKIATIVIAILVMFVLVMAYIGYETLTINKEKYGIPTLFVQRPDGSYIEAIHEPEVSRNDKDEKFYYSFHEYGKYGENNTIYLSSPGTYTQSIRTRSDAGLFQPKKFILEKYSEISDFFYTHVMNSKNTGPLSGNVTPPTTYSGVVLIKNIEVLQYSKRKNESTMTLQPSIPGTYIYVVKILNDVIGTQYYSFRVIVTPTDFKGTLSLAAYQNTDVAKQDKVKEILQLINYSDRLRDISLEWKKEQEENVTNCLTVTYESYYDQPFDLTYNTVVLFSLIPNVKQIQYQIGSQVILEKRETYEMKGNLKDGGISTVLQSIP